MRHLRPLLTVLFPFEIGSTLLLLATLGFVGYFVGGSFQLPTDQPAPQTFAGEPELGQMLQLNLSVIFFGPWRVAASGGLVALIVLAFNLLGDGLRAQLQRGQTRPSRLDRLIHTVDERLRERYRLSLNRLVWGTVLLLAALFVIVPAVRTWAIERIPPDARQLGTTVQIGERRLTLASERFPPAELAPQPAGALWSSQLGDLHGARGLSEPAPDAFTLAWRYRLPGRPTSSPVVDSDGNLYLAFDNLQLLSLTPDGEERWAVTLVRPPVGSPAIAPDGSIVVADTSGGLTVVSPAGSVVAQYDTGVASTPRFGPLVALDGTVYLPLDRQLVAVDEGSLHWGDLSALPIAPVVPSTPPVISAEGELIFYGSMVIRRSDGLLVNDPVLDTFVPSLLAVGGDGYNYMAAEDRLLRWAWDGEQIQPLTITQWDADLWEGLQIADMGVSQSGVVWLASNSDQFKGSRVLWIGPTDSSPQRQRFEESKRSLRVIRTASDAEGRALICIGGVNSTYCLIAQASPNPEGTFLPFSAEFLVADDRVTYVPHRIYGIGIEAMSEELFLGAFDVITGETEL